MNSCCLFSLLGCIDQIESGLIPLRDDLDALCATATHKQYTYVSGNLGKRAKLEESAIFSGCFGGGAVSGAKIAGMNFRSLGVSKMNCSLGIEWHLLPKILYLLLGKIVSSQPSTWTNSILRDDGKGIPAVILVHGTCGLLRWKLMGEGVVFCYMFTSFLMSLTIGQSEWEGIKRTTRVTRVTTTNNSNTIDDKSDNDDSKNDSNINNNNNNNNSNNNNNNSSEETKTKTCRSAPDFDGV